MKPAQFERLAQVIHSRSGLVLGPDKLYLLQARLTPLLATAGLPDLDALADRVCAAPDGPLGKSVVEALTTNETLFFRDGHPFEDLARVLPRLAAARGPGTPLRIWSAASSFGQEAYSIAIVASELRGALGDRRVEIVGTDIAQAALERARAGLYTDFEVQRGLSPARRSAHFQRVGAQWQVSATLRATVEFRPFNLLGDLRGLGRFDVVFCRNVLIYFDRETKRRVLAAMARQMAPDGTLYLGGTETLLGMDVGLRKLAASGGYVLEAEGAVAAVS